MDYEKAQICVGLNDIQEEYRHYPVEKRWRILNNYVISRLLDEGWFRWRKKREMRQAADWWFANRFDVGD